MSALQRTRIWKSVGQWVPPGRPLRIRRSLSVPHPDKAWSTLRSGAVSPVMAAGLVLRSGRQRTSVPGPSSCPAQDHVAIVQQVVFRISWHPDR